MERVPASHFSNEFLTIGFVDARYYIPIDFNDFNPLPFWMKSFHFLRAGQGRTPLHWTAMVGRCSTAELLLANGAQVDALDFGHLVVQESFIWVFPKIGVPPNHPF